MTTITGTQQGLQSTQNLADKTPQGPVADNFSVGTTFTNITTVTTSVVSNAGSASVTDGTTADPAATYVGSNGGTPMFAIKNPNGTTPPNLNNPLAAPANPASTNVGFKNQGTTSQGLIGNL
jgi:hypothetical protein